MARFLYISLSYQQWEEERVVLETPKQTRYRSKKVRYDLSQVVHSTHIQRS